MQNFVLVCENSVKYLWYAYPTVYVSLDWGLMKDKPTLIVQISGRIHGCVSMH